MMASAPPPAATIGVRRRGETLLDRYAHLIVSVGANVQPGQVVGVEALPEARPLVHRIARLAYARGARYVDAAYLDPHLKRLRAEAAAEETLDWVRVVFPDLEPADAFERLWRDVEHVCRLDEPDPSAA